MSLFFVRVSTAKWKTTKTQRGSARSAPPLWDGAEGAALLFFIWRWKSGIKNPMEIVFFIKAQANFWPQIENRLWVVLAINKTYQGP